MTALTNSPADVVRYALIAGGLGTLPLSEGLWPIFAWQEPDQPDDVVTVYDTSGVVQGRSHNDGQVLEHYGVQIRVRTSIPKNGNTKIRAILEFLDRTINQTVVNVPYDTGTGYSVYCIHAVSRSGTILSLGKDTPTTKRTLFTVNVSVSLSQKY